MINQCDVPDSRVADLKAALVILLSTHQFISEAHEIITSGTFCDPFNHPIIIGGHKAIGRMRQCERVTSTILSVYQSIELPHDIVMELMNTAIVSSVAIRFDSLNRYDISTEYGFLVTKWTASPTMLQFEEDEELRRLVYLSDGILDMEDLRRYIEHEHPWIMAECAVRKGRAFIEPTRCVSDDETAIGWLSPDAKNLFTLLESYRQLCAILSMPIREQRVSELEDALRECLELAWGRGGTYAVRKGYRVVLV